LRDGFLDIYVANYVEAYGNIVLNNSGEVEFFQPKGFSNFLYVNNGNGTFSEQASVFQVADAGGCSLAVAFTDYNSDARPDILLANDFGWWAQPNRLFQNSNGLFLDVSQISGANIPVFAMGIAIGDYDEDGDLDYYVTNIRGNVLMKNNGNGMFSDEANLAGVENIFTAGEYTIGWGAVFFDYDNDTYLDLAVANGYVSTEPIIVTAIQDQDKLYRGSHNGTFTDVSDLVGFNSNELSRGVAVGDYDNDGDLDIVVVVIDSYESQDAYILVYQNNSTSKNWLKIKLQGIESNFDGIGARVVVYCGERRFIRD
jgi:enediyne biosynthesis protein E4